MEFTMSPHLHITIVSLSLLALITFYIAWSMYKLRELKQYIDAIHDFVKFKSELDLVRGNPSKAISLYRDYIEGDA